MKRIYPLPEVFTGDRWTVRPGQGECDTVGRVLKVPLSADDAARFVRNHEMAHARITPRLAAYKQAKKQGVSLLALQVCEDMRVHAFLEKARVAMTGCLDFYEAQTIVRRHLGDERALAASLCSGWNTEDAGRLINILSTVMPEGVLEQLLNKIRLIYNRLLRGKGLYRWIGLRNSTAPSAKLFDTLFPADGATPADYGNIPVESLMSRKAIGKWGKMSIRRLPKQLSRQVVASSQQRIYRDEGSRLVAPYRMPVDQRVFVQKKRAVGGTVLIDASGSMNLSSDELRKIITAAPAATIAIYSGKRDQGTLTIIAENGRVVHDLGLQEARSAGSGNIIDGPCLRWLSTQQAPRVWVSDGLVTGKHDAAAIDLAVDAQQICTTHRIKRVGKTEAVVDLLKAVTLSRRWHGLS